MSNRVCVCVCVCVCIYIYISFRYMICKQFVDNIFKQARAHLFAHNQMVSSIAI